MLSSPENGTFSHWLTVYFLNILDSCDITDVSLLNALCNVVKVSDVYYDYFI